MAKRKHPTVKSLRQGQTVYHVHDFFAGWLPYFFPRYRIEEKMVAPRKHNLKRGDIIKSPVPIGFLLYEIENKGNAHIFYSYKQALRYATQTHPPKEILSKHIAKQEGWWTEEGTKKWADGSAAAEIIWRNL